jgi:hypothetical protein
VKEVEMFVFVLFQNQLILQVHEFVVDVFQVENKDFEFVMKLKIVMIDHC